MTLHEISPKQLRALLLLLVLVPFIPMVLMLRFMGDALRGEREAAVERLSSAQQRTLASAAASFEKQVAARGAALPPGEVRDFFRALFGSDVEVRIADAAGRGLAGSELPLLAQTAVSNGSETVTIQVLLADRRVLEESGREQFEVYAWTASIAAMAICVIAAAAGWTVHRQLQLHELKNTAVATVAHELRTPLATMRMLVETLREGRYRNEEQLREYLDLLHSENLRLSRLTEQFLTHSRLASGRSSFAFAPVSMREIAETAAGALGSQLHAPGCTFHLELCEPLPTIVADRGGLETVLRNLLDNALKHTAAGEKRIALRASAAEHAAMFTVEDNGPGVPLAKRRQIFEPFYQVDDRLSRSREGTGLGLSIAHGIVAAHRGKITVDSAPEGGSIFTVTLPLNCA